jgi:hypothetical protein
VYFPPKRDFGLGLIVLMVFMLIIGCNKESQKALNANNQQTNKDNISCIADLTYVNEEYGFSLVLPG